MHDLGSRCGCSHALMLSLVFAHACSRSLLRLNCARRGGPGALASLAAARGQKQKRMFYSLEDISGCCVVESAGTFKTYTAAYPT